MGWIILKNLQEELKAVWILMISDSGPKAKFMQSGVSSTERQIISFWEVAWECVL